MLRIANLVYSFLIVAGLSATAVSSEFINNKFSNTTVQSGAAGVMIEFDMSGIQLRTVERYDDHFTALSMPDEGLTYQEGMPVLPLVSRFVIVPPTSGLELIVHVSEPIRIPANHRPVICDDEELYPNARRVDLQKAGLYPNKIAEMSTPTIIRGVRLVKITTYPVQYDPSDNSFLHYENIQTELKYTNAEPVNPALHPDRRYRSREFMKFIDALAINADVLNRDNAEVLSPYAGHYLVAAHENCVIPAQPFIEWRRKAGYKMDIYSIPSGQAPNAGTVRTGIRNRYNDYLEDGIDPFDQLMIIGDRSNHQSCGPASNWIVGAETGESVWGNPQHADYKYGLLEGNDYYMDVGVSRWASGNSQLMALNVGRTLAYEAEPRMEDPEWFTRGGAGSYHWGNSPTSAWHVTVNTNVRWGVEVLQHLGYDDARFYENYDYDRMAGQYHPWIRAMYNDGSNVILSRAECYNWRTSFAGVNRNTVFPIRLNTSGHGEWATWWMTRSGSGNDLKGPVAATCGWGGPQTAPMTIFWLNLVKGVMLHDMSLGWGRVFAGVNFESYFPAQQFYQQVKTDIDCYGDPGIQPWQGVPQILELEHVESISPQTRMVEVYAFDPDAENNPPFEGARITLYVPGDLPDDENEGDDYAEHEVFQTTSFTDADGIVRFVFEDNPEFEEGTMYVTLTGRDLRPVFSEIDIEDPRVGVETAFYELIEIEGNEDENVNPGESFNLVLTAANIGNRGNDIDGVTAIVTSLSDWVVVEENEINFGTIEDGSEVEGDGDVIIHIDPSCPDGELRPSTRPVLQIDYISGDDVWTSAIQLDPHSPNFAIRRIIGGVVIPANMVNKDIDLENIGRLDSSPLTAVLQTLGMGISVIENTAFFPGIDAGDHETLTNDNDFRLAGNSIVVPGSMTEMMLILSSDNGFIDTTYFKLQTRTTGENAPQGPDGYGYICFDDTDTDWDIAPDYDWIEIATDERAPDFDGVEIEEFDGRSDESVGETAVIDLPFETQYYGHTFNQISVCTNGYICMGDQGEITNFQNWPMDEAIGGGMGMIAPFWDWLQLGNNGKVYTYYDQDEHYFIIEWYRLRHKQGGNTDLTFQVILYDHAVWVTESGDQNILFQYKSISQSRGPGTAWIDATPYASVGISSVDGTTGINYTFNNEYPVTSARLENQRALFFSTSPRYKACDLFGTVTDAATGEPISGAIVMSEHGFTATTNDAGEYEIIDALAEVPFDITARAQGYNDSTQYDVEVEEDARQEINFVLLHPEFLPDVRELRTRLDPGQETELAFSVENGGNGPLNWKVDRRLLGDANADPWDFRRTYIVGDQLDDSGIYGVAYIDSLLYVSGSNDGNPTIYILNSEGELVETFAQPGEHRHGMKDLAHSNIDNNQLIWGVVGDTAYGMTIEGEVMFRFLAPGRTPSVITWDPDRELLWIGGTTENIIGMDLDGNQVEDMIIRRGGLRIYGLAYFKDDIDHAPLYILHREFETNRQTLHKHSFETGEKTFVAYLDIDNGRPQGAFITNQFDVYSWVFISIANDAGSDRIDVWQIDARRDWFQLDIMAGDERVEANSGVLQTGETATYILTFNATELPETTFVAELFFSHNADSGRGHIEVELEVIGEEPPAVFDLAYPADGDTLDTLAVTFTWFPSFDYNYYDTIYYEAWFAHNDDSIQFTIDDTMIAMGFEMGMFNLEWMYENPSSWWVYAISGVHKVESSGRRNFSLSAPIDTLNLSDPLAGLPVEFSINSVYPNPFNSSTTVRFGIDSDALTVLRVFDIIGREVDILYSGTGEVGWKTVVWDASRMPTGIYFFRLESLGRVKIAKTALMR